MLETIATLIAIAATVAGVIVTAGRAVWTSVARLDTRFDRLEESLETHQHNRELERAAIESHFQNIEYRLETALEYGVHANRELIEHKMQRVEKAIATLSGALQRLSDGKYVPRGPDFWPTDNPPSNSSGG